MQTEEEEKEHEEKPDVKQRISFGPDYWRLPLLLLDDGSSESTNEGEQEYSMGSEISICAVCYMELLDGDAVRRLRPCGHCFHKHCIDRWLLESSTKCPVDNQELYC